jgi:putative transposase
MVIRKRIRNDEPALVFVTTTVIDFIPIFNISAVAEAALIQLDETISVYKAKIPGYVLMPTHLHMLLGLSRLSDLSRFMQSYKSLSTRRISRLNLGDYRQRLQHDGKSRLWKPRFDDLVITSEKQFRIKLEYIHNNPVKAGLVARTGDWSYSSAGNWLGDQRGFIKADKAYSWT